MQNAVLEPAKCKIRQGLSFSGSLENRNLYRNYL